MEKIQLTPKSTAALLRTVLKRAFPATKFSIVTERGSMVSSVRISWTDGPTNDEVKAFTGCFEMGRFDGMTDSYDYNKSADRQLIVDGQLYESGVRYVFEIRHISAELANACIKQVAEYWGGVDVLPVAIAGYDGYAFPSDFDGHNAIRADLDRVHDSWYNSIRRCAEEPSRFVHESLSDPRD